MVATKTITDTAVETVVTLELTEKKKRVGILGGTFNPPHMGHLMIAEQVGTQLGLDKVLFMPDNIPPHVDHKAAINGYRRLKMLQLAIADNSLFATEDIELRRGGISYTVDTIKELRRLHPDTDYYFIIGGDMVEYLPKWREPEQLMRMVQLVGVKRPGYEVTTPYPVLWVDTPMLDISSSIIRAKVKQGQSIRYLVPNAVEEYIREKGLYQ